MNPLKSIPGTIISGVVLSVIISLLVGGTGVTMMKLLVWFHVVVGITWIGILYYFNFVQVPAMAEGMADEGGPGNGGIVKYVAPKALWYFRWAALLTWLSGFFALAGTGGIVEAFTFANEGSAIIGVGAWLGTIMLLNVWGIIWRNQKKILGLDGKTHDPEVIAKAKATAFVASRVNVVLSIPMLMSMTAFGHGGFPF